MNNPHNKTYLFVHVIWSVKNRERLLAKPMRTKLYEHTLAHAKTKEIRILSLNGVEDHVHCLFQMHPTQSISATMQTLKGGSAFWFNQQKYLDQELKWQDGYAAYSVSPSMAKRVVN